jgi:hypothetical protein
MGRQVTDTDPGTNRATTSSPVSALGGAADRAGVPIAAAPARKALVDEPPTTASAATAATAPRAKPSAAPDILRKPAF